MGLRGPTPTPSAILRARGSKLPNYRKHELHLQAGVPACPMPLQGEAKAEWNRQLAELSAAGVLTKADGIILCIWCVTWADYVRLEALCRKRTSTGPGLVWRLKDARDTLLKIAPMFGMTPAARVRLNVNPKPADVDPMAQFFTEN